MSTNAFKRLMDSSKNLQSAKHGKRLKKGPKETKSSSTRTVTKWNLALKNSVNDPELVIEKTDALTVIKDKYPKATYHFLILPCIMINAPKELTKDHLPLLTAMRNKAEELIRKYPKMTFKIGFHAKPSMNHLHLHVVSQDFCSLCLKTKKHWNSFNTGHFLNISDVIKDLETCGVIQLPTEEEIENFLKSDLICNQCDYKAKTMPQLKGHLDQHVDDK